MSCFEKCHCKICKVKRGLWQEQETVYAAHMQGRTVKSYCWQTLSKKDECKVKEVRKGTTKMVREEQSLSHNRTLRGRYNYFLCIYEGLPNTSVSTTIFFFFFVRLKIALGRTRRNEYILARSIFSLEFRKQISSIKGERFCDNLLII